MSDRTVDCTTHGVSRAAYVCRHLLTALSDGKSRGVQWLFDDERRVNAWCDTCEDFLVENGNEWNDDTEANAGIRIICQCCFERLETFNEMKDLN